MDIPISTINRFWNKVKLTANNEACWNWNAALLYNRRYGIFSFNSKQILAHRFSFLIKYGKLTKLFICHTCDNPKCVNPNHLFEGTQLDNMRDMASKGRSNGSFKRRPIIGQLNVATKLLESQILEIRKIYAEGKTTQRKIGLQYGISQTHVSNIIKRRRREYI